MKPQVPLTFDETSGVYRKIRWKGSQCRALRNHWNSWLAQCDEAENFKGYLGLVLSFLRVGERGTYAWAPCDFSRWRPVHARILLDLNRFAQANRYGSTPDSCYVATNRRVRAVATACGVSVVDLLGKLA